MKKLFVIVCEASGDRFAADVIKKIDRSKYNITGIGGANLLINGLETSLVNIKELSVMGVSEVLSKIFTIKNIIKQTAKHIIETDQDVVLSFDSYSFCIRVAEIVKKKKPNIKFVHVVAPSVWMYGQSRAESLAKYYDKLFCILPFEVKYFKDTTLDPEFIGYHALYFKNEVYEDGNFNIGITLGSRAFELKKNIPIIQNVVNELRSMVKGCKFYFQCTNETIDTVKSVFSKDDEISMLSGEPRPKYNVVIAKSGTNTIEFAKNLEPMVVYYKVSNLTAAVLLLKSKFKFKFANLINIVAKRKIIPEMLQTQCNSKDIFNEVYKLITDKSFRETQIKEVGDIIHKLKSPVEDKEPADFVAEYLNK